MRNWNHFNQERFVHKLIASTGDNDMQVFLVSACLLGFKTRYDGRIVPSTACSRAVKGGICIPVCPEQLGGLPTPRTAADLAGGDGYDVLAGRARVLTRDGLDVTGNFILGARQVLAIARQQPVAGVILKTRSPSCGLSPAIGVTAALLQTEGYAVTEMD
jgi:uncharacterized protein YbbK (DUF523 family)